MMDHGKKLSRLFVTVIAGLWSIASCNHNEGSFPASPSIPGSRTSDGGASHPKLDDTKTGEPIGPVALANDGLGGLGGSDGIGGAPGLGGAPGGGVGAMGGLPQPSPQPTIGGH